MKKLILATAAATALLAAPAIAQTSTVPEYQKGSNHNAGGPANELNQGGKMGSGTMMDRGATTGTVAPGGAAGSQVPDYQKGSNHKAGGPANELNRK